MDFGTAITSFWTNYVNFTGRARRSEYWFAVLFLFLTNLAATFVDTAVFDTDITGLLDTGGGGLVGTLWAFAVFLPSVALLVRRLHDTGRSAWWLLIALIPLAGAIVLVVFAVFDSDSGENKYGVSPKHVVV